MSSPMISLFFKDESVRGSNDESVTTPGRFVTVLSIRGMSHYIDIHLDGVPQMIALGEKIAAEGRRLLDEAEQEEHAKAVAAYLEECGPDPDLDDFEVAR